MKIDDIYGYDKKEYAEKTYGTLDRTHPGVDSVFNYKEKLIGGEIFLINTPRSLFPELDLKPIETRVLFKEKGWKSVVAFQTRNPPHIGHEYVQKTALTFVDGIFINPIIGKKKPGDFTDDVILASYETLMKYY